MNTRTRAAKLARRCASIVERHHRPAMTWADWAALVGEVRAVSAEADRSGLPRRRIAAPAWPSCPAPRPGDRRAAPGRVLGPAGSHARQAARPGASIGGWTRRRRRAGVIDPPIRPWRPIETPGAGVFPRELGDGPATRPATRLGRPMPPSSGGRGSPSSSLTSPFRPPPHRAGREGEVRRHLVRSGEAACKAASRPRAASGEARAVSY